MKRKIVVATSGASGVNLGLKTLELLPDTIEKHFIMSKNSQIVLKKELNATIYKSYFAQLEVDRMYLTIGKSQNPYLMTYIGGGYKYYSSTKWSTILTLLYNVNPDSNQFFFPLDYRMAFVYNF